VVAHHWAAVVVAVVAAAVLLWSLFVPVPVVEEAGAAKPWMRKGGAFPSPSPGLARPRPRILLGTKCGTCLVASGKFVRRAVRELRYQVSPLIIEERPVNSRTFTKPGNMDCGKIAAPSCFALGRLVPRWSKIRI